MSIHIHFVGRVYVRAEVRDFFSYIACAQDFSFSEEDGIFTFWVRERRYNARFFDGNCGGKSPIAVEVVKVYCFRTTGFFFFFFFFESCFAR